MFFDWLIKQSKYYINNTSENVSLIPLTLKDKKNLMKYGDDVVFMYNEYQQWHSTMDLPIVNYVLRYIKPLYVDIQDLINNLLVHPSMELCIILHYETLIGFVLYRIQPKNGLFMLDVWIDKEYRQMGHFSSVHRILRRTATILKCKYMELEVLYNNRSAYNTYLFMGYKPYLSTYTFEIDIQKTYEEEIFKNVDIKQINGNTILTLREDFKYLWNKYMYYKTVRFKSSKIPLFNTVVLDQNINYLLYDRLDEKCNTYLFYYNKTPIGIITLVLSRLDDLSTADIVDFYFVEQYFEKYIDNAMVYIKKICTQQFTHVRYISGMTSITDNLKIDSFKSHDFIHRSNNLFLCI